MVIDPNAAAYLRGVTDERLANAERERTARELRNAALIHLAGACTRKVCHPDNHALKQAIAAYDAAHKEQP